MNRWGKDGESTREIIEHTVVDYYSRKLRSFGTTPGGVDWKDARSQEIRFTQLCRVLNGNAGSLIDYGCGYGRLLEFLRNGGWYGPYLGIDLSAEMIEAARVYCSDIQGARFLQASAPNEPADYAVASGIFNVRFEISNEDWYDYIFDVICNMHKNTRYGFAFNCLTSYADNSKMRPDLYYADPLVFFDLCKRVFSKNVCLLHDYDLYEFTIIVRNNHL